MQRLSIHCSHNNNSWSRFY